MKTKIILSAVFILFVGTLLVLQGNAKTLKKTKLKLVNQSIGEQHLKDNAVGSLRVIANDLITSEKIKNETLKNEDIAPDANISASKLNLTNLSDPKSNQDPATKAYVDNQLSTEIGNLKWKDPVNSFSDLPTCNSASDSHARLVKTENWIYRCDKNDSTWHQVANVGTVNHNDLQNRSASSSHPASAISFTPQGNLSATDLQNALQELDNEKFTVSSPLAGSLLIGNGTTFSPQTITGDVTITQEGVTTVADDSHLHTAATLPANTSYLGSSIESNEITDGTITGNDLAPDISISTTGTVTAGAVRYADGSTQTTADNGTTFRHGGERVGDYYCQKRTISDAGLRSDWENINGGRTCGLDKECVSGECVSTGFVCGTSQITDSENNTYDTVLIGSQCWLKQNLKIGTKLASGSTMPADNGIIEKWCYDNSDANCAAYGGLYSWDEAMQYSTTEGAQGICPAGWHIPTDAEQYTLENYLKDVGQTCDASRVGWDCATAGAKLKTIGSSPNFDGRLAGLRNTDGSFHYLGTGAYFWSSSQSGSSAWYRGLGSSYATVYRLLASKAYGFSVRCLKD